jgi:hypothetical protein
MTAGNAGGCNMTMNETAKLRIEETKKATVLGASSLVWSTKK